MPFNQGIADKLQGGKSANISILSVNLPFLINCIVTFLPASAIPGRLHDLLCRRGLSSSILLPLLYQ